MHERQPEYFKSELNLPILSEIKRPHIEEVTLFDWGDALAVDDKIVLAYKHLWIPQRDGWGENGKKIRADRILVARERTTPIKIQKTGREVVYPYPNQDELKGIYGVLLIDVSPNRSTFYVGEKYKVVFERSYHDGGSRAADVNIESTEPISADFIDGRMDYNYYLELLNNRPV